MDCGEHDNSIQQVTIEDCSKVSGAELTKESLTDVINANAIQIPLQMQTQSDGNKSILVDEGVGSQHNQSQLSCESKMIPLQANGNNYQYGSIFGFKNQVQDEYEYQVQNQNLLTLGEQVDNGLNRSNQGENYNNTSQNIQLNEKYLEQDTNRSQENMKEYLEEKPIVSNQLTFEQLMELKLQEEN